MNEETIKYIKVFSIGCGIDDYLIFLYILVIIYILLLSAVVYLGSLPEQCIAYWLISIKRYMNQDKNKTSYNNMMKWTPEFYHRTWIRHMLIVILLVLNIRCRLLLYTNHE